MYKIYYYNRISRLTYSEFSFYKLISLHKNDNILSVPNLYMRLANVSAHVLYATSTKYSKLEGRNVTIAIPTIFYTKASIINYLHVL